MAYAQRGRMLPPGMLCVGVWVDACLNAFWLNSLHNNKEQDAYREGGRERVMPWRHIVLMNY